MEKKEKIDKEEEEQKYDSREESGDDSKEHTKGGSQYQKPKQIKQTYEEQIAQIPKEVRLEWESIQKKLREQVIEKNEFDWDINNLEYVGGLDLSFHKQIQNKGVSYLTVVRYKDLKVPFAFILKDFVKVVYQDYEFMETDVPYCPGFLAFREAPFVKKLIEKMRASGSPFFPQVILFDGNGILHPQQLGLASHVGVECNIPTIGCSKTVFAIDGINKFKVKELNEKKNTKLNYFKLIIQCRSGDFVRLIGKSGRVWGAALKATSKTKDPLIISIGNKISLETALQIVTHCCKFRVPEPIRNSDLNSRQLLKKIK